MNGNCYFVNGGNYVKWNIKDDEKTGSDTLASGWGVPFPTIDACLVYPYGLGPPTARDHALIFYCNQISEYNFVTDSPGAGPFPIRQRFPGFPFSRIDACLVYPPGVGRGSAHNQAFFFCGSNYCSWDLISNTITGAVQPIASRWPEMPLDRIDAIVVYTPPCASHAVNRAYIFRGNSYIKWDLSTDRLDQGHRDIKKMWPGL
jgi:hypothetical protein